MEIPAAAAPSSLAGELASVSVLLKLRIVGLLVFVSLVSALVGGGGIVDLSRALLLAVAGALASAGAATLNQYFERDLDAVMARTSGRPLPAGRIPPRLALGLGLTLIVAAVAPALVLGTASTVFLLGGAFCYVVVYTLWLKRRSPWNVPIGGIAGSCAVMTGWAAATEQISAVPLLMAGILFFWNQSHFWSFAIAKQKDYGLAGVPMLPAVVGAPAAARAVLVNTLLMVLASLALLRSFFDLSYYVFAGAALGATFLCLNLWLLLQPVGEVAWVNFKFSGVYLLLLFLAIALAAVQSAW